MMSEADSRLLVSFGGHTLRVVSDSPQILQAFQTHLRHCPVQADSAPIAEFQVNVVEAGFSISVDGSVLFPKLNFDFTLQTLLTEAISRLVAISERGLILHSAALMHEGRAVILSGKSGSGKSSLAVALTADGLQYLTDEVIEISLDGKQIHTLPRSIFLKSGAAFIWKNLAEPDSTRLLRFADDAAWVDPQLFHPNLPASSATPRLLIFPHYDPSSALQFQKLTAAETLFRLLQNITNARNLPRHGLDGATCLAQNVTAYTLTYPNSESASEWIREKLKVGN
jgi:hypothetical protein